MSRYEYQPDGWPARYSLAIGWDDPLTTYFAQVMDHAIGREDNSVIVWLGGWPPLYLDIDHLMRTLNRRLPATLPAVALTDEMRATLKQDRKRGPAPERKPRQPKPVFALDIFPPDATEA